MHLENTTHGRTRFKGNNRARAKGSSFLYKALLYLLAVPLQIVLFQCLYSLDNDLKCAAAMSYFYVYPLCQEATQIQSEARRAKVKYHDTYYYRKQKNNRKCINCILGYNFLSINTKNAIFIA